MCPELWVGPFKNWANPNVSKIGKKFLLHVVRYDKSQKQSRNEAQPRWSTNTSPVSHNISSDSTGGSEPVSWTFPTPLQTDIATEVCLSLHWWQHRENALLLIIYQTTEGVKWLGCFTNRCPSSPCWSCFMYEIEYSRSGFQRAELKYQAALRAVRVKNMHLKKCPVLYWSGSLLSEVQTAQWWNGKRGRGNTFNCDASCAACHAKLVSCHTGVEPCIRFGCIPYPKVAVAQNGDPVVKKKKDKEADLMPVTFTTRSLSIKAMKI